MECTIVVISYNSARHIGKLLDSIPAAAGGVRTRCIVVDNGSTDETLSILRSRTDATVLEAGANLGYAGGINLARMVTRPCSSLLILNADLVLEPGAISHLHQAVRRPGVGMAVPMLLDSDGRLAPSIRREPSVLRALGEAVLGSRWPRRPAWIGEIVRDPRAYCHPQEVEWAGGAALLVSAACEEAVGDWDEGFFLYSEETDFAARVRRCGYRISYVPSARVLHEDGGSGRSPALTALQAVNRLRYYQKYHRWPATSLFLCAVALHYLLRCADPDRRRALGVLIRRSRWRDLPAAEAVSTDLLPRLASSG